ncbi:MAG TPA: C13 family peptidase, partial [Clostridiales bacterium]|nr:C13 family peptidase [Clostridiales bacterium]HQP70716.1 C13 family peptidase [Clostridiales bacterium]
MLKKLFAIILIATSMCLLSAEKYAVLVTGAKAPTQNDPYAAFWMDTYLMWEMLYLKGFDPANIYVLYADGIDCTNGYVDLERYSAKHAEILEPGYMITDYPATSSNLETVALELRRKSTDNDFLFVWTFGHGSTNGSGSSNLNLMDTSISDTDFATLFNGIKANKKVFWMAQCFGGGFKEELTGNGTFNNVIFSSAAQSYQESYFADNMPVENKSQPEEQELPTDNSKPSIEIDWYGVSNPQAHWEYNFHMYAAANQHKQHEVNSEFYYKDLTIDGVHYGTVPYSLVDGFNDPRYS